MRRAREDSKDDRYYWEREKARRRAEDEEWERQKNQREYLEAEEEKKARQEWVGQRRKEREAEERAREERKRQNFGTNFAKEVLRQGGEAAALGGGGFVPDRPAVEDKLNIESVACAISLFLLDEQTTPPLTIGLHAPWGHGKSSFMNFITKHLLIAAVVRSCTETRTGYFQKVVTSMRSALRACRGGVSAEAVIEKDEESIQGGANDRWCAWWLKWRKYYDEWKAGRERRAFEVGSMVEMGVRRVPDGVLSGCWWWINAWFSSRRAERDLRNSAHADDLCKKVDRSLSSQALLVESLARREVVIVTFNAWQHRGEQQVWAGLAATVGRKMETSMGWWVRRLTILQYSITKRGTEFFVSFVVPATLGAVALVLVLLLAPNVSKKLGGDVSDWQGRLYPLASVVYVVTILWRLATVMKPVSDKIWSYVSDPTALHEERLGYQNNVMSDLQFLHGKLPGTKLENGLIRMPRVVVFVDDLDRCQDSKVVEVLEAVNLILGNCNFFTVMGVDLNMVQKAVYGYYNNLKEGTITTAPLGAWDIRGQRFSEQEARAFLAKIIQVPLELPGLTIDDRSTFIDHLFRAQHSTDNSQAPSLPPERPLASENAPGASAPSNPPTLPTPIPDAASARAPFDPGVAEYLRGKEATWRHEGLSFSILKEFLPANPRLLKQMANYYRLLRHILSKGGSQGVMQGERAEVQKLAGWVVFIHVFPYMANILVQSVQMRRDITQEKTDPESAFVVLDGALNKFLDSGRQRTVPQGQQTGYPTEDSILTEEKERLLHFKKHWNEKLPELNVSDVRRFGKFFGGHFLAPQSFDEMGPDTEGHPNAKIEASIIKWLERTRAKSRAHAQAPSVSLV